MKSYKLVDVSIFLYKREMWILDTTGVKKIQTDEMNAVDINPRILISRQKNIMAFNQHFGCERNDFQCLWSVRKMIKEWKKR